MGNFSEIPYEKTLREDAHAAVRQLSPNGDQRRRAKSAGLPSGLRGWGEPKSACGLCSSKDRREDAAEFSKGVAASQRKTGHGNVLTGVC